jgi:hypothetical protein
VPIAPAAIFPYLPHQHLIHATRKASPMRAEIEAVADDIRKSLALLRRHL